MGAAAVFLPLAVSGCGGGGADDGSTGVVVAPAPAPTPGPSPSASPTPSPSPSPSASPTLTGWSANAAALFTTQPDVPNCQPGVLAQRVRDDVLTRLNAIRALHHLPAVSYSTADDEQATQAALMMAANGQLSHTPPTSWACYTNIGATGAGTSNLYGGLISPYLTFYSEDQYLGGWLIETTNLVADNVGHRRWMLDPFLGRISYSRVAQLLPGGGRTDAAALKVFSFNGGVGVPTGLPAFVAYPQGDYPARYFDPAALLSFSVVADATRRGGANASVDFAGATVTVRSGATTLAVSNVSFDNVGYGLPNNLQFKVAGLRNDTGYDVTIGNVIVRGAATSYSYSFRTLS